MEEAIQIFEPNKFWSTLVTIVSAVISIGIIVYLFYYQKKELSYDAKKRRGMISIVLGTLLLLTTSTGILNWWNSFKIKPVTVYQNSIDLPKGNVLFKDIRKAFIFVDKPMTIASPPPDSLMNYKRLLIIEEKDDASHALSEANYPIEEILEKMRSLTKKK